MGIFGDGVGIFYLKLMDELVIFNVLKLKSEFRDLLGTRSGLLAEFDRYVVD